MSDPDTRLEYDLDRIFADPKLMEQPVIAKAKKMWDQFNLMRNRYIAVGMAVHIKDYAKATICNDIVHDWAQDVHLDTHRVRREIANKTKKAVDQKRVDDRRKETMTWLEDPA